jgi:hypothetical protein
MVKYMAYVKQGSEFQVNTYTTNNQQFPSVATLDNGNFVVIWKSISQNGNDGIYGQIFKGSGVKQGTEFLVSNYVSSTQEGLSVSAFGNSNFVVTWSSFDGNGLGVYGQVLSNSGVKQGASFLVNNNIIGFQLSPSVGAFNNTFVVAYESFNIYGQIFNGSGIKQGAEFLVNTNISSGSKFDPTVTTFSSGNFIIEWSGQDKSGESIYSDIYGQIFNSSGVKQGTEFLVNTFTVGNQKNPSVAALGGSNFVTTWLSYEQDGSFDGVYGQIFSGNGVKQGTEFLVNTFTTGNQQNPSVAAFSNGNFVVAWQSLFQESGSIIENGFGVYGQVFNSNGMKQGSEFHVNTYTLGHQQNPSVAVLNNGGFVVLWQSNGQDGSGEGVYAQIFSFSDVSEPTNTPTATSSLIPQSISSALSTSSITATSSALNTPSITPSVTSSPSSSPFSVQEISSGGSYNGTTARENFIINTNTSITITGGGGDDRFTVKPSNNINITITDFDKDREQVDLSSFPGIRSFNDFAVTQGSAIVDLPENQKVILQNLQPSDISSNNFIYSSPTPNPSSDQGSNLPAIIGGAVGGAVGLLVIGLVGYAVWKSCHNSPAVASAVLSSLPAVVPPGDSTHTDGHFDANPMGDTHHAHDAIAV